MPRGRVARINMGSFPARCLVFCCQKSVICCHKAKQITFGPNPMSASGPLRPRQLTDDGRVASRLLIQCVVDFRFASLIALWHIRQRLIYGCVPRMYGHVPFLFAGGSSVAPDGVSGMGPPGPLARDKGGHLGGVPFPKTPQVWHLLSSRMWRTSLLTRL